jgi:hypothetical protein
MTLLEAFPESVVVVTWDKQYPFQPDPPFENVFALPHEQSSSIYPCIEIDFAIQLG